MSLTLLYDQKSDLESGFSIGICAADSAANMNNLLEVIENESYPDGLELRKIVLVASGCDPKSMMSIQEVARRDHRLELIEEPTRRGKSAAINQIIENLEGEFLVLVNSDALPKRGAISRLLSEIASNADVGMVSASPVVGDERGIMGSVLRLIWGVHNECLLRLSQNELNNHCCDELVVARSEALQKLPADTVNDGAFMAGNAHRAGYSIKYCEEAKVTIDLPHSLVELVQQRRRIVYGHFQILKSVGESPRTLESLLIDNPAFSISILVKTLSRFPRLMLALPVALLGEAVSVILAMCDSITSTKRHAVWDRFGSRF